MVSDLPTWTTVGFTGHRELKNPAEVAKAIGAALDRLQEKHGPLAAVSSAASGADTLFVEAVAGRGMPYFLILPFTAERFRQDFSPDEWERVAKHFDGAANIEVVHDVESANEAYLDAGVLTVDRADLLIAVWNGERAAGKGGTADVVGYARHFDKPIVWINPADGGVREERLARLPLESRSSAAKLDPAVPLRELVQRKFEECDAAAEQHGPTARQLILYIIRLHLAATAVGLAGLVFHWHGLANYSASGIKLLLLFVALWLSLRHRYRHHEWISARAAAEVCRSFLAVWAMRRRGARFSWLVTEQDDPFVKRLRMAWYLDRDAERTLDEARRQYVTERIRHQQEYFREKYDASGRRAEFLKSVATCATVAALVCGAVAMWLAWNNHLNWVYQLAKFFGLVFPLVPPAVLSIIVAHDLARRAQRSVETTRRLDAAERHVSAACTWPGLWREVSATEDLLSREVAEWNALMRFGAESH